MTSIKKFHLASQTSLVSGVFKAPPQRPCPVLPAGLRLSDSVGSQSTGRGTTAAAAQPYSDLGAHIPWFSGEHQNNCSALQAGLQVTLRVWYSAVLTKRLCVSHFTWVLQPRPPSEGSPPRSDKQGRKKAVGAVSAGLRRGG